ncbi:MAG: hypothetical protein IPO88_00020 [Nannocystis sp.]|uniref:hypothetical protein n=1 Tax=Nannocystis sp. TaxID=1962667 RepID=UPI0024237383|nr:hypothetical protein [Nannocystis sp.]MBK9751888.1 hypothetical protein [Nannocystis sp.]
MRAVLLPFLVALLACKPDSGDDTGGSSTGDACTDDAIGDKDPNYPPCTCDYKCEGGSQCRFTNNSSICQPECMEDAECPSLSGISGKCNGGHCYVPCNAQTACPSGYVCLENIECQAER